MWLYSYPSILLSTSHQNGGAVLEQWGPVSQSPVGQEVTSLRTRLSTPPMLGLAVLVLTIVPAYLLSRPNATDTARTVVSIARSNDSAEAATDEFTAVEIEAHIRAVAIRDRKSTRLNSSHGYISYAVFCLKKKKKTHHRGHY